MVTAQELISIQLKMLHRMQVVLEFAAQAAASHELKTEIEEQIIGLDQLETQFHILAPQRGWSLPDTEPTAKLLARLRFHRRKDPAIAENLLHLYTNDTVYILKSCNRWNRDDASVSRLLQNHLDWYQQSSRQMQPYL